MVFEFITAVHAGCTGTGKIAHVGVVRAFAINNFANQLGNEEVKIGVALAMTVAAHIDWHSVHCGGEISAVVQVEATQKKLVGLAITRMLCRHQARN